MKKLFYTLAAVVMTTVTQAQTARVMAIHNSPDSALQTVDVWLTTQAGSVRIANDFSFRQSTGYIDAPAGQPIRLSFAPRTSTAIGDTLIGFGYNLTAGQNYLLMAQGTISAGYNPVKPFGLQVVTPIKERILDSNQVAVTIFHGSNDAPEVFLEVRKGNDEIAALPGLEYNEFLSGIQLPTDNYFVDIYDADDNLLTTLSAPLETLGLNDSAVVIFASGFLNPAANANGPAFGIYAALSNGTVIQVPQQSTFRLQVFHNCADSNARNVDIWLVNKTKKTNTKLLSNFAFRTATPYINAPAIDDIIIGVAPAGSSDTSDVIYYEEVGQVPGGLTIFAAALGVLNKTGYAANPNGVDIGFQINGLNSAESATEAGKVLLNVLHGSTDAPRVDVKVASGPTLFSNLAYTDGSEAAVEVAPASYTINITPAGSNTVVAAFTAPLTGFTDSALTIVASGFLNPAANKNGAAFGLFAVTKSGNVIALPSAPTSTNELDEITRSTSVYPNPAKGVVNVSSSVAVNKISITDISGRTVINNANISAFDATLNVESLIKGMYIMQVHTDKGVVVKKLMIE
jgi:hypothetical protein